LLSHSVFFPSTRLDCWRHFLFLRGFSTKKLEIQIAVKQDSFFSSCCMDPRKPKNLAMVCPPVIFLSLLEQRKPNRKEPANHLVMLKDTCVYGGQKRQEEKLLGPWRNCAPHHGHQNLAKRTLPLTNNPTTAPFSTGEGGNLAATVLTSPPWCRIGD
jgi:hypothetical protein